MYQQRFCHQMFAIALGGLILASPSVFAQVAQLPLSISRSTNENFDGFVQRATTLTTSTLKNRFEREKSLNQLRVVVIGENDGAVAPVLAVTMSRQQWLSNPHPEPLINYFPDSKSLLGFDTPTPPVDLSTPQPSSPNAAPTPEKSPQSPTVPGQPPAEQSPASKASPTDLPSPVSIPEDNGATSPSESAPTNSYGRFREATTQPASP